MTQLTPIDVRTAAHLATEFLGTHLDDDWSAPAGSLEWDCRETIEHIIDSLDVYAVLLATRAQRFAPAVRIARDPAVPTKGLLRTVRAKAAVLAEVAKAAPSDTRAFHPRGWADASGFAAMGCDEILIHTADIVDGLGDAFRAPADLTTRVLKRLFPWAPDGDDPWATLLWANDRIELPLHGRIGEKWTWWSRPLAEWDGMLKTRDDTGG